MARRAFYSDPIARFLARSDEDILGTMVKASPFPVETTQRDAWQEQITICRKVLPQYSGRGTIYFEYSVPRMGRRIDAVLLVEHAVFVVEFKVGEKSFRASARDQVCDYALDLKHFHEPSHDVAIAPILVATQAPTASFTVATTARGDGLLRTISVAPRQLADVIDQVLAFTGGAPLDAAEWDRGRYSPTPTIIEAAMALYGDHDVADISRSDASAINLSRTSQAITEIIRISRQQSRKSVCFVTGVPGAGKTLVGLNIATQHLDKHSDLYSVFLSGNGPLVSILREALARDKVRRQAERGERFRIGQARSEVKAFIQNVHNFRDECLTDDTRAPIEHVALFDEAQRAWNRRQTEHFMQRKRSRPNFGRSEPEFLLSCMDRHPDWAVVVCLVGGGQEINTGEAGIGAWIEAVLGSFPEWHLHVSPRLTDTEYGAGMVLESLRGRAGVHLNEDLHLGVSLRSFRTEHVSALVKAILDREEAVARNLLREIEGRFPIVLTRDLKRARSWLREQALGSERYGIVVSSEAQRLKPHAIDVRAPTDPVKWFLAPKEDVRSSYYLEDVATEFDIQGLELDWTCVVWDADFRVTDSGWQHFSFVGDRWNRINKSDRQAYLKNAYRVLLTRARQGMVVVVPEGDSADPTRAAELYDPTYNYLSRLGLRVLS